MITRRQCLKSIAALAAWAVTHRLGARSAAKSADWRTSTALDLAAGLRTGAWRSRELTEYYIKVITALNGPFERFDDNGGINAFVRIYPEQALAAAERADHERNYRNWSGIPVALKDVFGVAPLPVTVGSPAFARHRARVDCTAWQKWKAAGAVFVGHTQAQRFVSGLETPQTANPWNHCLTAGGSSGGSAAAVAAGMIPVALGGETDGSLIYPAACCGITTLKPSHGLLSLAGVYPALPSFDVVGPMARSAADCCWVLYTLAGVDDDDPFTAEQPARPLPWPEIFSPSGARRTFQGVRFLVSSNEEYRPRTDPNDPGEVRPVDPRIKERFDRFLESLQALGAEIVAEPIPVQLGRASRFRRFRDPRLHDMSAREVLVTVDKVRRAVPVYREWLDHATEEERAIAIAWYGGSGRRLESDTLIARASHVTEEVLTIAKSERTALSQAWQELLDRHRCDAHLYLEINAPLPERHALAEKRSARTLRMGVVPNDLGWPVLGLPVGMSDGLETPVSVQMMAPRWNDHRLISWGMAWQQEHAEIRTLQPASPIPQTA